MKRLIAACITSLAMAALLAPAAQGASQLRHYQDRNFGGQHNQVSGEIQVDILFKNKVAKGPFTPRQVRLVYVETLPISCEAGGERVAAVVETTPIKMVEGRFAYEIQDEDFDGAVSGKVYRRGARANGAFNIRDFDPSPPEIENCATDGPQSWDAGRCRKSNEGGKLPICRVGGGS